MFTDHDKQELCKLIDGWWDETLTEDQAEQLKQWVCRDDEACRFYLEYTNLHSILFLRHSEETSEDMLLTVLAETTNGKHEPDEEPEKPASPILGFLGDAFQAGANFVARPPIMTLLLAVGLPGIILLLLLVDISRQSVTPGPVANRTAAVAEITREHACVWGKATPALSVGTPLDSGRKLQLREGFVELTFANKAVVILEGPTTFQVDSCTKGFLQTGRLVARVEKETKGFTIQTPSATIVDLGTEFGVSVDSEGLSETHVFKGKVEVAVQTPPGRPASSGHFRVLSAGEAVRISSRTSQKPAQISTITASSTRFVRDFPATAALASVNKKDSVSDAGMTQKKEIAGINIDFQGTNTKDFSQLKPVDYVFPNGESGNYCSLQGLTKKPSRHTSSPKTWSSLVDRFGAKTGVAFTFLGPDDLVGWAGVPASSGKTNQYGLNTDYLIICPKGNNHGISTDGSYKFKITGLSASTKYRLGLVSSLNYTAARGMHFTFAGGETCIVSNASVPTNYVTVQSDATGKIAGTVTCPPDLTQGNWGGMTIEPALLKAIRSWNLDVEGNGTSIFNDQDTKPHPHAADASGNWNVLSVPAVTKEKVPKVTNPSVVMADSTGNRSNPVTFKLIGQIGGWTGLPGEDTGDASLRRDYLILRPVGHVSGLPNSIGFELTGLVSGARYALTFIHSSVNVIGRGLRVKADLNGDNRLEDETPFVITSTLTEKTVQFTANKAGKLIGTMGCLDSLIEGDLAGIQLHQLSGGKP